MASSRRRPGRCHHSRGECPAPIKRLKRRFVMLNSSRKTLTFAAAIVSLAALVGTTASAETTWQKNHPRRTQVNSRLANQNRRIHNDVKDGTLTKGQAANLHREDHQVRQEER